MIYHKFPSLRATMILAVIGVIALLGAAGGLIYLLAQHIKISIV